MTATPIDTDDRSEVDPHRVGLVWMDTREAIITRWQGQPTVERLESSVPPMRKAVGSVRRGPARPSGGGRVPGHGTKARHLDLLRGYFADLADRMADLEVVEVAGRGMAYEQFADLLRRLASRRAMDVEVTTWRMSKPPTEPQLVARLREMVGEQLPRLTVGSRRSTDMEPTAPSGRHAEPSEAQSTNAKRIPVPERQEIEREIEIMLADDPEAA